MNAAQIARSIGFKTLEEVEYYSGFKVRTLQNKFNTNRQAFKCILLGAVAIKNMETVMSS